MPEVVYFDEDLKGDRMLVTDKIIAFRGSRFDSGLVDGLSTSSYRRSVNAIPQSASYCVSVSCLAESITVDCAGFFWFGQKHYDRLCAAVWAAAGRRLVKDAMQRLASDGKLNFACSHGLKTRTEVSLSRRSIHVWQKGMVRQKEFDVAWRYLKLSYANGSCRIQSYNSGDKVDVPLKHLTNNVVFTSIVKTMTDKANYRMFET